ncbi:GPI-GlcNAc transferase complex, PIG-H component-domain-containing protein [Flagelloscypha sp. PMI_526]|nr:GPI-GlcNAc transferase complex, PIG-H component-domain-containing protein [Flagelloscypha sp. PMI_526]
MKTAHPLPLNPELWCLESSGVHEFRVGRRQRSHQVQRFLFTAFLGLLFHYTFAYNTFYVLGGTVVLFMLTGYQVQYESLFVVPLQGIQLETRRGWTPRLSSSNRRFIPFSAIQDVFINEALYGWNVRYYLAFKISESYGRDLVVAFPNLLPKFDVVHHVYRNILRVLPT